MRTATDYPMLSVKRSPQGDELAIRNARREDGPTWTIFSEEGELWEADHADVADWQDLS